MANATGCLKYTLFGCLGFLVIIVLFVGITALVALNRLDDQQIEDRVLTPVAETATQAEPYGAQPLAVTGPGRLVLDFAQGEFYLHPAEEGEGLSIRAVYDAEVYQLDERYENLPDSPWVYQVRFYRTVSALHALFRHLLGGGHDNSIHVYIPPDLPIELEFNMQEGGCEVELGGLWITAADINCRKGGIAVSVAEPMREPMQRLSFYARMGGVEAVDLGNASPRVLDIDCSMGGADVDLRGAWLQDCAVSLAVKMGGMDVRLPRDVEVRGLADVSHSVRHTDVEVPRPVLTFDIRQNMGEIEVR